MPPSVPSFPSVSLTDPRIPDDTVRRLQNRLLERGCGPLNVTGKVDGPTVLAVKRFQMRFSDVTGRALAVDGVVGPLTWEALFGSGTALQPRIVAASMATDALEFAVAEVGVMESPPGSNRGPRVDEYVRSVGLKPADALPWCAGFVYWCFEQAAVRAGRPNPAVKTGGVLKHWHGAGKLPGVRRIPGTQAIGNPALVQPGFLFAMDFGKGVGHIGFVAGLAGGQLVTIEGNTGPGGTREGIGVFQRTARRISSINLGFIDYSGV